MSTPWGGGEHTPMPGQRWLASLQETISFRSREAGGWVSRTAVPKIYLAGAWVLRRPKRWDGSAWVDLP